MLENIRRCDRLGCGLPAKWQIALRIWGIGHSEKPKSPDSTLLTGMCVCNQHKPMTRVVDLLDDGGKANVTKALHGQGFSVLPDFPKTEIEWVKLEKPKQINPNSWARFKVIDNPDRRWYQCHFDSCDSEAIWHAYVVVKAKVHHVYAPEAHEQELTCETTIKVCDRHRDKAAKYLLSDRNREELFKLLKDNNITYIDLNSLRVAFGRWEKQQ